MKIFEWLTHKSKNNQISTETEKSPCDCQQHDSHQENSPCGCSTEELDDFMKHITIDESPVYERPIQISPCGCGCGCGCDNETEDIELPDDEKNNSSDKIKTSIPQLEYLLTGHTEWCKQIEQSMRDGTTNQYAKMSKVGSELLCCIGQWLQCEGKNLRHYTEYTELQNAYDDFKSCTLKMLDNHQKGLFSDAVVILRGNFNQQSLRVQKALRDLVNKMRSETKDDENAPEKLA
ncbi:hypothetical protein JF634_07165 [Simonsiella muelleri]|uniref:Chemoreceptor zinc-binding domain-containing protein n=1 Tax=Simonsiella muelleri ATCC 29453 TaxID=641147 RepID=V9HK95_9NEIS|nr:hypothetical protein [Simonsiella muelleri]AUX60951.1 hypothetical protein BWP33_03370 [Simonsiella muelleri ATCC 29453]EFG30268.2 hypothetical protein HMPREF9021_01896 [Simonsiella muelleri ATCC 29453]UBQ52994.1 hypothetical protein JF634_07165 [Simonsiella muelleri]